MTVLHKTMKIRRTTLRLFTFACLSVATAFAHAEDSIEITAPLLLTVGQPPATIAAQSAYGRPVSLRTLDPEVCFIDADGFLHALVSAACRIEGTTIDDEGIPAATAVRHVRVSERMELAPVSYGLPRGYGLLPDGSPYVLVPRNSSSQRERMEGDIAFVQFSASGVHQLAIDNEGRIHAWGKNVYGAVGDGTTTLRTEPVLVTLPDDELAIRVVAGAINVSPQYEFSFAIGQSGQLYTWGLSSATREGSGWTAVTRPRAFPLPGNPRVVDLVANQAYALALDTNGTIYWWATSLRYAGPGSTPAAVAAPGGVRFKQMAVSAQYQYALSTDGSVYLINGSGFQAKHQPLPPVVQGRVISIHAGKGSEVCLIDETYTLHCFASFWDGALSTPLSLPGVSGVDMDTNDVVVAMMLDGGLSTPSGGSPPIAPLNDQFVFRAPLVGPNGTTGGDNAYASYEEAEDIQVRSNLGRTIWWSWVAPADGLLDLNLDGSDFDTLLTVFQGTDLATLRPVAANGDAGARKTSQVTFPVSAGVEYQIRVDGQSPQPASRYFPDPPNTRGRIRLAWSLDTRYLQRLIDDPPPRVIASFSPGASIPLTLNLDSGLIPVVANESPTFCNWSAGRLYFLHAGRCRLSISHPGDTHHAPLVQQIDVTTGVPFGGGWLHSIKASLDRRLMSWGFGETGSLADGTLANRRRPGPARSFKGEAVQLSTGMQHTLVVDSDGKVHAYGVNISNELGAPPDPDHEVIAGQPAFPDGVRILQTAAAGAVSAALGDDGNVYAWGRPWGQSLGTASTQGSWIPSRVLLPPDANPVAVAVSESYTLLLTADGRVFSVGNLAGRYPTMEETKPQQLSFPEGELIESISVSATHALAVTRTGELFGWGATRYGALGIADDAFQETPVRISLAGTPRVVAASAHGGFSAILTADDRLLVSGPVGQVGRTIASFTPDVGFREIALPSGVQPVQLPLHGYSHLLVMASDGQLYGWGDNDYGQLGLGDLSRRATPVRIPVPPHNDKLVDAISIAGPVGMVPSSSMDSSREEGESDHNVPLQRGSNWWSYRTDVSRDMLFQVLGSKGPHALALYEKGASGRLTRRAVSQIVDGAVQLHWSMSADTTYLIALTGGVADKTQVWLQWRPSTAASMVVGESASLLLSRPNLPLGTALELNVLAVNSPAIEAATLSPDICAVSSSQVIAIRSGLCSIEIRVQGDANGPLTLHLPVRPMLAQGRTHQMQSGQDGSLLGWGSNNFGQIGTGTVDEIISPAQEIRFPGNAKIVAIAAFGERSAAIGNDGRLYTWGVAWPVTPLRSIRPPTPSPEYSSRVARLTQAFVSAYSAARPISIRSRATLLNTPAGMALSDVKLGGSFGLVMSSDGAVLVWGDNNLGQLGNGSFGGVAVTPRALELPLDDRAIMIAPGLNHGLAVMASGNVYAWGDNRNGQSGGSPTYVTTPSAISLPGEKSAVLAAAGDQHSLALLTDGQVLAWGSNRHQQLGYTDIEKSSEPLIVSFPDAARIIDLVAAANYSAALDADGKVYVWGQLALADRRTIFADHRPRQLVLPAGARALGMVAGPYRLNVLADDGNHYVLGGDSESDPLVQAIKLLSEQDLAEIH